MSDYKGEPFHSPRPDVFTKVERLNKLGQVVVDNPEHFDMSYWFEVMDPDKGTTAVRSIGAVSSLVELDPDVTTGTVQLHGRSCGTRACLAGWAVSLWAGELTTYEKEHYTIQEAAEKLLDLETDVANDLFNASAHDNDPETAAEALRELADEAMAEWRSGDA